MSIAYLNGLGKTKKKFKPFKKVVDAGKKLDKKARERNKKIVEKHKKLAKKIGAGVKRIARISKNVQFKAFIHALEKNFMGLSTRLKQQFKIDPSGTRSFLSKFGDYEKIKNAINSGDKKTPVTLSGAIRRDSNTGASYWAHLGEEGGEGGGKAGEYAEATKQGIGIIAQIIAWFKKRKAEKSGDKETVEAMTDSVDADPEIPKVDENGKPLPADTSGSGSGSGDDSGEGESMLKNPYVIGGLVLGAGVIGYMLLKKK